MTGARRPPRLLVKALTVTFVTVALLLVVVFVFVTLSVRGQVRQSVTATLESSQRLFAALETRRQKEMQMQASALAENPTLKAALDTYQTESRRSSDDAVHGYLLSTIDNELRKVAAVAESDALVLVDTRQNTIGAAGRFADRWPRGRAASFAGWTDGGAFDGIARAANGVFRVVALPLRLDDARIGTFYAATSLDQAYADELARLAGSRIAIVSGGRVLASTLTPPAAREFESHVASTTPTEGTMPLDGDLHAFRRLVVVGDTSFYALGSIDELSRSTQRAAMRTMAFIAIGAAALALIGSFWLARLLTEPIDRLSTSLAVVGGRARCHGAAADDRLEPRGRRAHRDVQRVDGVGGRRGSADRGGVHGGDSRAGGGARRARSVHGRTLGARQRAVARSTLSTVETTAGYRVTSDITLRSSYYARKSYNARAWDNQVGVSVVWAHRWW